METIQSLYKKYADARKAYDDDVDAACGPNDQARDASPAQTTDQVLRKTYTPSPAQQNQQCWTEPSDPAGLPSLDTLHADVLRCLRLIGPSLADVAFEAYYRGVCRRLIELQNEHDVNRYGIHPLVLDH